MKALVKNTAMLGGTEFLLLFVSIVRNKYLAINIGAEGFGVFNLISNFFQFANLIAGSWLSAASLKYISEYNSEEKKEEVKILFNLTFYLVIVSTTIITGIFIVLFPVFKSAFLSPEITFSYYAFFAASFWGNSITNIFRVVLQGLMDFKSIIRIRIISQVFNLLIVIVLVYFFDLLGVFINVAIIAMVTAFLFYLAVKKKLKIEKFDIQWYKTVIAKKIIAFSSVDVFLLFLGQSAKYFKRILIVNMLSMSSLGLFAAVKGILKLLELFTKSSLFHFKPQMSKSLSFKERATNMNDYFRMMLIIAAVVSTMVILFSSEIVPLLYSKEFTSIVSILYIFIIAQYLRTILFGYTFSVLGMAKLKIHSFATVVSLPVDILISYLYIEKLGLIAIALGSIVAILIHLIILVIYFAREYKIYLSYSNFYLTLSGFIFISSATLCLQFNFVIRIVLSLVTLVIYSFYLTKNERMWILDIINNKILRKK